MYNLDQLRMFVTAAKLGSFSACARKLGKAQSAVSHGISNLEIDLNVELFDRSTRKPTLTKEGQHLLTFAEATLQQAYELESASKSLSNNEETQLTLAIDDALQVPKLFSIIESFAHIYPATTLNMVVCASSDMVQLVNKGLADIGVMLNDMTFSREVDICYIGNLTFVPVVSKQHSLTELAQVTSADLIAHRQLMVRGVGGEQQSSMQPFSSHIWWTNDYRTLKHYVERGLGWAYLPKHLVEGDSSKEELHRLPVTFDHKPWSVPVESITQKSLSLGPAAKWLISALNDLLDSGS
ncbi:LysR family transcriptional regulator [Photobacterium sanctipauli]|uniref:LysR family transcriptional regulator n=1 Tax=Photobacterium sanctipauli TaxID=1342794 RepID=UPI00055B24EE|nr:LysR family transcriptional regulator [Photobacterium sanctipauli]